MHHLSAYSSHRNARAAWAHSCNISLPDASVLAQHISMGQTPRRLSGPTSFSLAMSVTNSTHRLGEIHAPRASSRSSHLRQAEIGIFELFRGIRLSFLPGHPHDCFLIPFSDAADARGRCALQPGQFSCQHGLLFDCGLLCSPRS